jgi:hypothetical protein
VRFADVGETDAAMAAFHARGIVEQMCGAEVLGAVRLDAALFTFDGGLVRKARDTVFHSLSLEGTHMHLVIFTVATHNYSFSLSIPGRYH